MGEPTINRKAIALLFLSDYARWSGGMIYILNIVRALNSLEDRLKPKILILHGPTSPIGDMLAIGYPYMELMPMNTAPSFLQKALYKIKKVVTGKTVYYDQLPDVVYPYSETYCLGKYPYYWIPDFQEWHLPQMFSEAEVRSRKSDQLTISKSGGTVVFSSENARSDFEKFYPEHNCTLKLLRFASALPPFQHVDKQELLVKYNITAPFFMSPNQFWKHKNHITILEAITLLKSEDLHFQVIFTGSENDYRNKDYFQTLKTYIADNQIERWVRFLGFIPREDQLALMDASLAIIQPSLFEGWSTVVEDTKALSQYIILSDIGVHQEQISDNCAFFPAQSPPALALEMKKVLHGGITRKRINYEENIYNFGTAIVDCFF